MKAYTISINDKGYRDQSFSCKENEYIRDAMNRAGLTGVPRGCGGGGCGICKIKIVKGEVVKRRMSCDHISDEELEQDIMLACCVKPKTNVDLSFCNLDKIKSQFK